MLDFANLVKTNALRINGVQNFFSTLQYEAKKSEEKEERKSKGIQRKVIRQEPTNRF